MQAVGNITTDQSTSLVKLDSIRINESKLQISLLFYNSERPEQRRVDLETLLSAFYEMNEAGKNSNLVLHYINWYYGREPDLRFFEKDLQTLLTNYSSAHPGCPYQTLDDLTPKQIVKLDKKYFDPDYDLVLEW